MTWKAKQDILWFSKGQVIEEIQDNWKPYFENLGVKEKKPEVNAVPDEKPKKEELVEKRPKKKSRR